MTDLLARLESTFLRPVATPPPPVPLEPGAIASVAVVGPRDPVLAVACGIAVALAADDEELAWVAADWPFKGVPTAPPDRRAAAAAAASGDPEAHPAGRLVRLPFGARPDGTDDPFVLAVARNRTREVDALIAVQERIVLAVPPDLPEALIAASLADLAQLGRPVGLLRWKPSPFTRFLLLAGRTRLPDARLAAAWNSSGSAPVPAGDHRQRAEAAVEPIAA